MKKIINSILVLIMFFMLFWISLKKFEDENIKNSANKNILEESYIVINKDNKLEKNIIKIYNGYEVSSKITIPKISLEAFVLENYSESALKVSVTKFWGADANEIGNFCIAGHNFKNKNMFHDLNKLEINDTFFIEDNKNGKYEYKIYDFYKVYPDNITPLAQNTNGFREVTLITCTNDSKERIIIKAKEI